MTRFIVAFFFCLLATLAEAAPVYVQGNQNSVGSASTVSVTLTSPVTSGDILIVTACASGSNTGTVAFTDNKSNTYTVQFTYAQGFSSAANYGCGAGYIINVTNGPQTITMNSNATSGWRIFVDEYSGIVTTSAIDGTPSINVQHNAGTGANAITSNTTTTTQSGDLIYGFSVSIASQGPSNGTGFNPRQSILSTWFTEDRIQSGTGAIAATMTDPSATDDNVTYVIAFKATAGGGGSPHNQMLWGF